MRGDVSILSVDMMVMVVVVCYYFHTPWPGTGTGPSLGLRINVKTNRACWLVAAGLIWPERRRHNQFVSSRLLCSGLVWCGVVLVPSDQWSYCW